MNEVKHLKKCIRQNIEEIKNNQLKDTTDIESLMRFCIWIRYDAYNLIKEWKRRE